MGRDPRIEEFLDREQVDYVYQPSVAIETIDRNASLANQARLGAKENPDVIQRYALAMIDGDVFPAMIGFSAAKGIVLCDGNQRLAAYAMAEKSHVDMYLLKTVDAAVTDRITRVANLHLTGWGIAKADILEQAKHDVRARHLTQREAARYWHLKESELSRALRDDEARTRLGAAGVRPANFGLGIRNSLNAIKSNVVFAELAHLTEAAGLDSTELAQLVPRINAARDEKDQLAVVIAYGNRSDIQERRAQRGSGRRLPKPGHALSRLPKVGFITTVENAIGRMEAHPTLAAMGITGPIETAACRERYERFCRLYTRMMRNDTSTASGNPNGADRALTIALG